MLKTCEVQKNIDIFNELITIFPEKIQKLLNNLSDEIKINAQEIRVRTQKNIIILYKNNYHNINLIILPEDIENIFKKICNYSIYTFQEQIKNGYITFKNGHRIGLAGSAVVHKNNIINIKNITSLNIRIARESKNCSKEIFKNTKYNNSGFLIIGAPMTGKTTILRDLSRLFSVKNKQKVVIIDERYEIAAVYENVPQLDIGFSDVLSGFQKSQGILMALRTLSPDIIICDEIGSTLDAISVKESLNSGVKIIATMHARNLKEFFNRPQTKILLKTGAFNKIFVLNYNQNHDIILKKYNIKNYYD